MSGPPMSRIERARLAGEALKAAVNARREAGLDQINPICVYDLAEKLGVPVRFTDINMEGIYTRLPKPCIQLSIERPPPRRAFTCGHELGHHVFGHGMTVDEAQDDSEMLGDDSPNEVLANAFSGFVLMPTVGLRGAFGRRGSAPATADELTYYAIASNFGVGYTTLIAHLRYALDQLPQKRAKDLAKASPKSIRKAILGADRPESLVYVDPHWIARPIDAEVGTLIVLPPGATVDGTVLEREGGVARGDLWRAIRPGIGRVSFGSTSLFVRIARQDFVGLARYRHLEDDDDV